MRPAKARPKFDQADKLAPAFQHSQVLNILARADVTRLAALAESLLPKLGEIEVVHSCTGLVMLPLRDTVQGTDFHLGEVLVAEAYIRAIGHDGYRTVVGRDMERAMSMASVDAAVNFVQTPEIRCFLQAEAVAQADVDFARLRKTEATRVTIETF